MSTKDLLAQTSFIKSLARSLVRDENIAADISQNTYLVAIEHPPVDGKFHRSWIRRVVHNIVKMMYRKERRRKKYENRYVSSEEILTPEEIVIWEETVHKMVNAVFSLEEPYRSTILLRYYNNFKIDEIAERMKTSSGTVSGRIKRGLDILRIRLDKSCTGKRSGWILALAPIAGLKITSSSTAIASGSAPLFTGAIAMTLKTKLTIASIVLIGLSLPIYLMIDNLLPHNSNNIQQDVYRKSVELNTHPSRNDSQLVDGDSKRERIIPERINNGVAMGKEHPNANIETVAEIDVVFVDANDVIISGISILSNLGELNGDAISESNGAYHLKLPKSSNRLNTWIEEFTATKPGFLPKVFRCTLHAGDFIRMGQIVMQRSYTISGYVKDEDGRYVSGASIGLINYWPSSRESIEICHRGPPYLHNKPLATSGLDGSFIIDCASPGKTVAWAKDDGRVWALSDPFVISPDKVSETIVIYLKSREGDDSIKGFILDPKSMPVPKAKIYYYGESKYEGKPGSVLADDGGRFSIPAIPLWKYSIVAQDPDGRFGEIMREGLTGNDNDVVLQFGEPCYTKLVILDEGDRPIENYEYEIHLSLGKNVRSAAVKINANEPHTILIPNCPFQLRISAYKFFDKTVDVQSPQAIPCNWVIHLSSAAAVSGRVFQQDQPAIGAIVELRRAFFYGRLLYDGCRCIMSKQASDSCITDEEGAFLLSPPKKGKYFILARMEGFAQCELGPIYIDPTVHANDLELHLNMGGILEGTVLTPVYGDTLGKVVRANHGDGQPRLQHVGEDGHYRFDKLSPGHWEVRLLDEEVKGLSGLFFWNGQQEDTPWWNCEVYVGQTTIYNLETSEPCIVIGRLILPESSPVGWSATLTQLGFNAPSSNKNNVSTELDKDGKFQLQVNAKGKYKLLLRLKDSVANNVEISDFLNIMPGTQSWELSLPTGSVNGVCGPMTIEHMESLIYRWRKGEYITFEAPLVQAQDGRFRIPLVPAGPGSIIDVVGIAGQTASPVHPYTVATVEVEAGLSSDVVLP